MTNKYWWLLALRGVAAIIFGLVALFLPQITIEVLVFWFGAFALLAGVLAGLAGIQAASHHAKWGILVLDGLLGVAIGLTSFVWPASVALFFVTFVAIWSLFTGFLQVFGGTTSPWTGLGKGLFILSGLFSILFGALLLVYPLSGIIALAWLMGIYSIAIGTMIVGMSFSLKS